MARSGGKRLERPGVRRGYDLWASTYDATPNPVVALDRKHTFTHLRPAPGEAILDAGCGTGVNLRRLREVGARPVGLDFSPGMLRVAQRNAPGVPLAQADLNLDLPLRPQRLDALLCCLVSEHLTSLEALLRGAFSALRQGGRLAFSAFHPAVATAGAEANFEREGTEYRLGAQPYSVSDYLDQIHSAGFGALRWREYEVDAALVEQIPAAARYLGRPLLLVVEGARGAI